VDRRGVHVANLQGMRRAVAALDPSPGYVLTDGFSVSGFAAPSIGVVGGDRAAACIAGASVLAKVTRDRIMVRMAEDHPDYGFAEHKGYGTRAHLTALREHGPSSVHRWSFANVAAAARRHGRVPPHPTQHSALSTAQSEATEDAEAPPAVDMVQNDGSVSATQGVAAGGSRRR
jgi:ribonuclease HII